LKRAATLILALAAIMSVVLVGGAAGHKVKFDSTVTAKFKKAGHDPYTQPARFEGTVDSVKPRCVKNRTVNLRLLATDGSSTVVASDVTDLNGAWLIQPASAPAAGTYFAEAAKKVLKKNSKHRHVCRAAVSKDLKVK
jgi:hypothetical protein